MPEDVIMIAGHATRHTCNDADGTEWDRGKEDRNQDRDPVWKVRSIGASGRHCS
jgi:hypothetical protein